MNELVTDIKNLELETLKNLKNSKSANTLRAYKADFKDFSAFCAKNGLSSMPTEPKILSLYLTYLSATSKFSTLKRRIASISVVHKLKGHYIDTKHPLIMENLHGIKRVKGTNQKAKKPILINQLKLIIKVIDQYLSYCGLPEMEKSREVRNKIRDKAIILIGFSGGFRRSELVNIYYDDVEFVTEGVKIFIKRSKTDQSGEGMTKAIPYFDNITYCPVLALKQWIEYSEIKSGKFFDISDKSVSLIIKKYASLAGLDPNKYGGHSLRSGFATSAAESGAEERNIMAMTGHKTTQMVRRYIQEANLFKNNALNKIKI
jgi:site-specific recombinase XerD|tara:strand:+ start:28 stop:978 length:951 start_codon:yes stop_codon:yes gene_type:complete